MRLNDSILTLLIFVMSIAICGSMGCGILVLIKSIIDTCKYEDEEEKEKEDK